MFHPLSKIRSLGVAVGFLSGLCCVEAQYSGVGVSTPVRLANPAFLVERLCECLWVGYEPNRFGLPELSWVHVGGAIALARAWWGAVEFGGRSTEVFSQVHLRCLGARPITDFFAVGIAVEGYRFAVSGLPTRWWGTVDVGVAIDGGSLRGGVTLHNVLPALGNLEVLPVRLGMGVGWRSQGWGVGVDAVLSDLMPAEGFLSFSASVSDFIVATVRLGGVLPQVHLCVVGQLGDIGLELAVRFHTVLGWRYAVTVLYRWR